MTRPEAGDSEGSWGLGEGEGFQGHGSRAEMLWLPVLDAPLAMGR